MITWILVGIIVVLLIVIGIGLAWVIRVADSMWRF